MSRKPRKLTAKQESILDRLAGACWMLCKRRGIGNEAVFWLEPCLSNKKTIPVALRDFQILSGESHIKRAWTHQGVRFYRFNKKTPQRPTSRVALKKVAQETATRE